MEPGDLYNKLGELGEADAHDQVFVDVTEYNIATGGEQPQVTRYLVTGLREERTASPPAFIIDAVPYLPDEGTVGW
jgi:hypothetical protein